MESTSSSALITIRQTMKLYEQCLDVVRQRHQLSRLEAIIISFLHNNPGHDTVGEIADMRMLSKGNVSRGADSLIKRGFLERIPDQVDRRWVHLKLKDEAEPIVRDITRASRVFGKQAFAGFSEEDLKTFHELHQRLAANVEQHFERSHAPHGKQGRQE